MIRVKQFDECLMTVMFLAYNANSRGGWWELNQTQTKLKTQFFKEPNQTRTWMQENV